MAGAASAMMQAVTSQSMIAAGFIWQRASDDGTSFGEDGALSTLASTGRVWRVDT